MSLFFCRTYCLSPLLRADCDIVQDHLIRHSANRQFPSQALLSSLPQTMPDIKLTDTIEHRADFVPNFHCPTCNRPFKRLDLLQRHEKRGICGDEAYAQSKRRRTSESSDPSQPSHTLTNHPHSNQSQTLSLPLPTPDFVISDNPDWGFGLWPPDPWEALLHDTLAPPFGEPAGRVHLGWSGGLGSGTGSGMGLGLTPRMGMQESAERGGEGVVGQHLVDRLQRTYPVSV